MNQFDSFQMLNHLRLSFANFSLFPGDRYSNVWPNQEKQVEHQTGSALFSLNKSFIRFQI